MDKGNESHYQSFGIPLRVPLSTAVLGKAMFAEVGRIFLARHSVPIKKEDVFWEGNNS